MSQPSIPTPSYQFSRDSTSSVPNSLWFCSDFILGAGTVIIQPATRKVVLLYSPALEIWFLPKGRKNVGESLEGAALREAYEESGYRAQFLPLRIPSRAPAAETATLSSTSRIAMNIDLSTEPIFIQTHFYGRTAPENGGEYITFWYAALIGPEAIREEETRMADEQDFQTFLMPYDDAVQKLKDSGGGMQALVVKKAYEM